MVAFIPTLSGVSMNVLDMTGAIAPFLGTVLVGFSLASLVGIVATAFIDHWQMRRQPALIAASTTDVVVLSKAA